MPLPWWREGSSAPASRTSSSSARARRGRGGRTAPYRVEIIDAALGESLNATNALAGCWIPEDAETYALWLDVLRRRGIDVDT